MPKLNNEELAAIGEVFKNMTNEELAGVGAATFLILLDRVEELRACYDKFVEPNPMKSIAPSV